MKTLEENTVVENNKLIAEFMQYKKTEIGLVGYNTPYSETLKRPSELLFNSSWDWLMPVVEKITKIVMEDNTDVLYNSEEYDKITHSLVSVDINMVYKTVIEFIKWYNENNNI